MAEDHVAIGHGRARAAAAVAGRPRIGARALRADMHAAAFVDPGNRAAAGADRDDVDVRAAHRIAVQQRIVAHFGLAVADQRHVEAGTPHVAGDRVRDAHALAHAHRRRDAARWPRLQQRHRPVARDLGWRQPAVRLHEIELRRHARFAHAPFEGAAVLSAARPEHRVHHGRAGALVFHDLGVHLDRGGDEGVVGFSLEMLEGAALVLGIDVAVDEADRDRLDAVGLQLGQRLIDVVERERRLDLAVIENALTHFEPPCAWHEVGRVVEEQIVKVGAVVAPGAADFQDVAEALGGQERGLRALALDHHVGRDRSAVADEADVAGRGLAQLENALEAVKRADRRVARGRGHLGGPHLPGRVIEQDDVGERSANVDTDPSHAFRVPQQQPIRAGSRPAPLVICSC